MNIGIGRSLRIVFLLGLLSLVSVWPSLLVTAQSNVNLLFPNSAQLPAGMVLVEQGSRSANEIAATFPDPDDAASVLATWGWTFNAYRVYEAEPFAGSNTPVRLELSLHQFSSNAGASYALSYFAHGRAVVLDQAEGPVTQLRPCEAAVTGDREASRYLRIGSLLVRATSFMPASSGQNGYFLAIDSAADAAYAVLANTGTTIQVLDQICQ